MRIMHSKTVTCHSCGQDLIDPKADKCGYCGAIQAKTEEPAKRTHRCSVVGCRIDDGIGGQRVSGEPNAYLCGWHAWVKLHTTEESGSMGRTDFDEWLAPRRMKDNPVSSPSIWDSDPDDLWNAVNGFPVKLKIPKKDHVLPQYRGLTPQQCIEELRKSKVGRDTLVAMGKHL